MSPPAGSFSEIFLSADILSLDPARASTYAFVVASAGLVGVPMLITLLVPNFKSPFIEL